MEKPREGEWSVRRLPRLRMMLYPYVHTPMAMAAPPKALGSHMLVCLVENKEMAAGSPKV